MPQISFQPFTYTDADIEQYLEIEKSIDTPFSEVTTDAEEAKSELQGMNANFVLCDGKTAGFVAHQVRTENDVEHGYIWEIVLLPEYRGKGIGEVVMRRVLNLYESLPSVCLQVDPNNTPALTLYEKLGFIVKDRIENATDTGRPRLRMCRSN